MTGLFNADLCLESIFLFFDELFYTVVFGAAALLELILAFLFAEPAFKFLLSEFTLLELALLFGALGVATTGGFFGV
ncbi:hypothetical protein [Psychrobacter arcticus]|uniref:hypothetical protein n=1 Tax=Psychrobacter arcticus TaxID=334543 RepID=UPI00003997A2|nr:hypothetical protein [Psychrobacter arcticus]